MIDSAQLLTDLKRELRLLEDDLRVRAEDPTNEWGAQLRQEHNRAQARERTGLPWIEWRDGEVSQAAVAWIIATVFIRFAEDNGLLEGADLDGRRVPLPWIAAPAHGLERAIENEAAFYATTPTSTSRDWLQEAFRTLAALPAGRPLVDPDHSPVWRALISASASDALLAFFRKTTPDGALVHNFRDPELGTRFLGDLYQDLSDYAKKTFALLQTPVFVEEFILDLTLTPAIAEFGLTGLKIIDPTCGSGHFLLGAFDRLTAAWREAAPAVDLGERVQRALDSIHGVDLNPFAVAIARFRLTVAAIKAAGIPTLAAAPAFRYHLAIGDSLLGGMGQQAPLDLGEGEVFEYAVEDLKAHTDILRPAQYHVVVGNPPYITVTDRVLSQRYRARYKTCMGKYSLAVPFMELFFGLARRPEAGVGAGHVGQITSNSFMKRTFGKKLINDLLSGEDPFTPVDLTHVVDTARADIPGHSTPTVILVGRRRKSVRSDLRAVLGVRGGPPETGDPSRKAVWREIVDHIDDIPYDGRYVTVSDVARDAFASHPWSLSGGGAADLRTRLDDKGEPLGSLLERVGFFGIAGSDEAMITTRSEARRNWEPDVISDLVVGDDVRDYALSDSRPVFFPYDAHHQQLDLGSYPRALRRLWPLRTVLGNRATFSGQTYLAEGRPWWEWHQLPADQGAHPWAIAFAEVATHNHFVLDKAGHSFKQTAPIIKLPRHAAEEDFLRILGALNSSAAAFWIRQVAYKKGGSEEEWSDRFQLGGTSLLEFPMPAGVPVDVVREMDVQARRMADNSPRIALRAARNPREALTESNAIWEEARRLLVALQEELDWSIYVAFGLADASLAPIERQVVPIEPNERPFEVRVARALRDGAEPTTWFERHGRLPLADAPQQGAQAWRDLWQARYDAAESGFLQMLERPEYKRRWAGGTWGGLVAEAVTEALLDRLESPELWCDSARRPMIRSAAHVSDDLRRDGQFRELLAIHLGSPDFDLTREVGKLLAEAAVPRLAALRYKASGIEKFRAWEKTWDLQRAGDRGDRVTIDAPPGYEKDDFVMTSFWVARGRLDVPKERFVSFAGSKLPDDTTELYGWAGWDHAEMGQAVARLANDLARAGAPDDQVIPLVGVLLELEPWLKQWHDQIDARAGVSPAAAVAGFTTSLLGRLGIGRDNVIAWRPPTTPSRRGRRSAS